LVKRTLYRTLPVLPPILFLGLFFFYPLADILLLGFRPRGEWDWSWLDRLIGSRVYLGILWFTVWQAALSTLLTLVAALPGAWLMARFRFPGKGVLRSLVSVPFVLPTVVVAAAFQALLGRSGVINTGLMSLFGLNSPVLALDQTLSLILLAHVFYNYSVVLRIVGGFWSSLDPRLTEAARMLGASRAQAFYRVTLPLLAPAVQAAALLVFVFCFSSFGVVLILGGPRFSTIEVEIYRQAVHLFNLPMAAGLSLVQIVFTFLLMRVYARVQRRRPAFASSGRGGAGLRPVRGLGARVLLCGNLACMAVLLIAPLGALLLRSVQAESGLSMVFYRALFENVSGSIFFVPPGQAVLNSVMFAFAAMGLALVLGLGAATYLAGAGHRSGGSILDPLFMLPLSTSAVTLGFGFIIAFDTGPLNLRGTVALVPLAQTLVAFPFVVRALLPTLRSIPGALREAASLLGAPPWKVWLHVDLPIIGRALVVGAVFAFSVSMGEFGATVFTARPQTPTMPLAIYRLLGQPGAMHYGQAMAMSSLLMLVTAGGFLVLERFRPGSAEEF
jgi:thiamine transport system permease protein